MEWATWIYDHLVALWREPRVSAVGIALLIGGALTEAIAQILPSTTSAWQAKRITILVVFGVGMCVTFAQMPDIEGFLYGLFAGLAAPTLYHFITRAIYARWPALKPGALDPCRDKLPPNP